MAESFKVNIREAEPNDIPFIYSVWLRSYKHHSPMTRYIFDEIFYDQHQARLDDLLADPQVTVAVACDESEPDVIYGFMAYEGNTIHFVYVKEAFRRKQIARQLIQHEKLDLANCQASHLTYSLIDLWKARKTDIKFNPYLFGGTNGRKST